MAFLVGSKGIGTPTWGHSLKVDPYLWSSKLSFLYDIDYLRNIENLYGNEVLKQYILEKLKAIDKFDDCLVITDFTKFTETGTNQELAGAGDSVSWEKTTDELKCTITTDATEGGRHAWAYTDFASNVSKLFFSCIFVPGPYTTVFEVGNASGATFENPPDMYAVGMTSDFCLAKNVSGSGTTLACEGISLVLGIPYKVGVYLDLLEPSQKAWRELDPIDLATPTISATDTDITAIKMWRFRIHTINTSTTETYKWKVPLIVAWKS